MELERVVADSFEMAVFEEAQKIEYGKKFDLKKFVNRIERRLVVIAMEEAKGNCCHAAKILGLGRTTLVEKRRKFRMGLNPATCRVAQSARHGAQ